MTTYFLSPGQKPVSEVSADPGTAQLRNHLRQLNSLRSLKAAQLATQFDRPHLRASTCEPREHDACRTARLLRFPTFDAVVFAMLNHERSNDAGRRRDNGTKDDENSIHP